MSNEYVLVATSMNYLRIFTIGGFQRTIISLPGAPVSITADGEVAAIVYNGNI